MQGRSRETVAAILEATTRILDRGSRATTNGIARLAGVSIGSLYEYFPNKQAIVEALLQRHEQQARARLHQALREVDPSTTSLADGVRHLVEVMLALHTDHPRLHRVLVGVAMSLPDVRAQLQQAEHEIRREVIAWLRRHPQVDVPNLEVAGRILVQGTDMLVHRWLEDDHGVSEDVLADELTRLWVGYLGRADGNS